MKIYMEIVKAELKRMIGNNTKLAYSKRRKNPSNKIDPT